MAGHCLRLLKHCGAALLNLPGIIMYAIRYNRRRPVATASHVQQLAPAQHPAIIAFINFFD
jgi:hypothetical protein